MKESLSKLKKGLKLLKDKSKARRDQLMAKLSKKIPISSEDEEWLDLGGGNLIEEERAIEALESASSDNYEHTLAGLQPSQREAVQKLREAAGDLPRVAGNKRKRPEPVAPKAKEVKAAPKPVFEKKENATLAQRIEILDWHHKNGKNQTKTAEHFDEIWPNLKLKQPRISGWLRDEQKWRSQWDRVEAGSGGNRDAKRVRQTEHPVVDEMLDLWVSQAVARGVLLTDEILRQKWVQFADLACIPADERGKQSNGWLQKYKKHMGLKSHKRHGEAGTADPAVIDEERRRMQELLAECGYELRNIFNMDETGLFYALPPDRGLSDRKRGGVKGRKVRLTYAFTCNADGSQKLPPFIIGKAEKPRPFKNKTGTQLGFYYRNNAKAWMTASLYEEWLRDWDRELGRQQRRVVLLQDNFSGHIVPDNLQNIRVIPFMPNLTAHVQPLDQGIIRCFKAHYRARYIQRAIDRYDRGVTPSQIYDINQLEAMRLAETAWREVSTSTIRHCWKKAQILPTMPDPPRPTPSVPISTLVNPIDHAEQDNPVVEAEASVTAAMNELASHGALHTRNRMTLDELLNPEEEDMRYIMTEGAEEMAEEDICAAVIASRDAKENGPINGGDDYCNRE